MWTKGQTGQFVQTLTIMVKIMAFILRVVGRRMATAESQAEELHNLISFQDSNFATTYQIAWERGWVRDKSRDQ